MFYYIDTIEQVKKKDEEGHVIEGVNEYGKREICKTTDNDGNTVPMPLDQVRSKFFKKLSDVSADLVSIDPEKNSHFYMVIKIVNTEGKVLEENKCGVRQESDLGA